MADFDYQIPHTQEGLPAGFSIGWLLNPGIRSETARSLSHNLLDFYSFKYRTIPQYSADTIEQLLEKSSQGGHTCMMIMQQGITLGNFIELFKQHWYTPEYQDSVIIGHVLDRKDRYWQIHPQAMFVNTRWWVQAGKPEFGERNTLGKTTYTEPEPLRSQTHLNVNGDDYAAEWIKSGTEPRTYTGHWEGYNFIRTALNGGHRVTMWNTALRKSKSYMYGEQTDYWNNMHVSGDIVWEGSWYQSNTESFPSQINDYVTGVVLSVSGALSPILNAYTHRLKPGGKVVCLDMHQVGLHMQWVLFNQWDGTDYAGFIKKYRADNPVLTQNWLAGGNVDAQSKFIESLGTDFTDWMRDVLPTFRVEYKKTDIFNVWNMRTLLKNAQKVADGDRILLDISNALNYEVTAILYELRERLQVHDEFQRIWGELGDQLIVKSTDLRKCYETTHMLELFPWSEPKKIPT
jgi:hypothetical protein